MLLLIDTEYSLTLGVSLVFNELSIGCYWPVSTAMNLGAMLGQRLIFRGAL